MEDHPFASQFEFEGAGRLSRTPIPDQIEVKLVRYLWNWCASRNADPATRENPQRELIVEVDHFLRSALLTKGRHPAADRLPHGLWLDGILECSLEQLSDTFLKAVGFTFWADGPSQFYLAPFECEFYFQAVHDPECCRIIVRFGELDDNDQLSRKSNKSRSIWNRRCVENSDWAYAVELS